MSRILVVEDEPDIALGLRDDLARHGYDVDMVGDGQAALARADAGRFDLILLDVMMPELDGYEVCRALRTRGDRTPIILLTAKVQEAEKVLGLELGADDYVTKPFSPAELRARIKAVLRRTDADGPAGVERFGDVEVDFDRAEVRRNGEPVVITALELRLLKAFLSRRGRVLSRAQIIDLAWDAGTNVTDRVVDTHILHLRQKIEPVPAEPQFIRGVRGIGYRFDG